MSHMASVKQFLAAWLALALDGWKAIGRELARQRQSASLHSTREHFALQWARARRKAGPVNADSRIARLGQNVDVVGVLLTIVVAAVVGYVGLIVGSETEDATDFDTSQDAGNQTEFENASESLTGGIETSFSLVEVVFITLMLALIIGTLVGLRRR